MDSNSHESPIEGDYRYERKYLIDKLTKAEIRQWVKRNPAQFVPAYPPRWINNIYFDTLAWRRYNENTAGLAERIKIRIRWYGELFGPARKPTLEFKIKKGQVGTKDNYRLPDLTVDKGFNWRNLRQTLESSDLPMIVKREFHWSVPTLINRYYREYYISADRHYRITLDSDMSFYRVYRNHNTFAFRVLDRKHTVMELKYDRIHSTIDQRLMNYFPFRITKMSKYVYGLEQLLVW